MNLGRRLFALLVLALGASVVLPSGPASAAPITTWSAPAPPPAAHFALTADCVTTEPLTVAELRFDYRADAGRPTVASAPGAGSQAFRQG